MSAPAHLDLLGLDDLRDRFGLAGARAILLVGSRTEERDYPGSDTDFLGVFAGAGELPAGVAHPGAVSMPNTLGASWIGFVGEHEVNVTMTSEPAIRRAAAPLGQPISAVRAPALQQFEISLLHRVRSGIPVAGESHLAALRRDLALDRLDAAVFVLYHVSAAGHLVTARRLRESGDCFGFRSLMTALAGAIGIAALSMYGTVTGSIAKIGTALPRVEAAHPDLPVRRADLVVMTSTLDPELGLDAAAAALRRLELAARRRAEAEAGPWAEAIAGLSVLP